MGCAKLLCFHFMQRKNWLQYKTRVATYSRIQIIHSVLGLLFALLLIISFFFSWVKRKDSQIVFWTFRKHFLKLILLTSKCRRLASAKKLLFAKTENNCYSYAELKWTILIWRKLSHEIGSSILIRRRFSSCYRTHIVYRKA